jgi:hypothetical protein
MDSKDSWNHFSSNSQASFNERQAEFNKYSLNDEIANLQKQVDELDKKYHNS